MSDNRLRTFLTLCSEMNYRRASEKLGMTQPAVTQQIHRLEEEYRCRLFDYSGRKLTLTEQGASMKRYAENVLYQEKELKRSLEIGSKKELKLGATKTIGEYAIADMVEKYLSDGEGSLNLDVDNTENLLNSLRSGDLDIAMIEGFFDTEEFAHELFRRVEFVGLCGKDHPLAGRTVPLDVIMGNTLFLREEGSGTRRIFEMMLEERNRSVYEFDRTVTVSNFGLMTELIRRGCGITFGYRSIADASDGITMFRIDGAETYREFNYVFLDTPYSRAHLATLERLDGSLRARFRP